MRNDEVDGQEDPLWIPTSSYLIPPGPNRILLHGWGWKATIQHNTLGCGVVETRADHTYIYYIA